MKKPFSGIIEMSDSRIRPTWIARFNVGRILVSDKKTMSTHCGNSGMIETSDSRIRPTWIVRFRRRSDTCIRQKADVCTLRKFGNDWNVGFENPTYMYSYPTKKPMFTPCENSEMI